MPTTKPLPSRAEPDIGGRYSALSYFGMVPGALMGLDFEKLLRGAETMVDACGARVQVARKYHPRDERFL